jgi:hypothetical protein
MALWLSSCADDRTGTDLPPGWEAAERIEELVQHPCGGNALSGEQNEVLMVSATDRGIDVAYDHAHFRCVQDVEAFAKRGAGHLDILVQPIDMNPSAVAGCDCLYDISMSMPMTSGSYRLSLYRRWDNLNKPNAPVGIGSFDVDVD